MKYARINLKTSPELLNEIQAMMDSYKVSAQIYDFFSEFMSLSGKALCEAAKRAPKNAHIQTEVYIYVPYCLQKVPDR